MRWRKLRQSENVQDRRGRTGAVVGGIGGLGVIGVLLALLLGGGEGGLGDALNQLQNASAPQAPAGQSDEFEGVDDSEAFVRAVLGSTEDVWQAIFDTQGQSYPPASLVLFTGSTQSGCGGATSAIGPHYCPTDQTIYIDLGFYDDLQRRFGAAGGDFAEAYVTAHEVAHHVQNVLGIMEEVRSLQQGQPGDANSLSVSLELQADCMAGVWANAIFQQGNILEPGDIREALDAASAVGDDRIQRSTTGRVDQETWTHGSSEQRVEWFNVGYETGQTNNCNPFGDVS